MNNTEAELETFRQKWREEVSAKTRGKQPVVATPTKTTSAGPSRPHAPRSNAAASSSHGRRPSEDLDEVQPHVYHDLGERQHGRRLDGSSASAESNEPRSALEHYEKAVEKESQGILGDSLNLYRKAFKVSGFEVLLGDPS